MVVVGVVVVGVCVGCVVVGVVVVGVVVVGVCVGTYVLLGELLDGALLGWFVASPLPPMTGAAGSCCCAESPK